MLACETLLFNFHLEFYCNQQASVDRDARPLIDFNAFRNCEVKFCLSNERKIS